MTLQTNATPTPDAFDALTKLIVSGDLSAIKATLKEQPALMTSEDKEGWTPLIWAAAMGMANIMQYMIDNGAPLNNAGKDGLTALMAAAEYNDEKLVMPLLDAGAAKLAKDNEGQTAADYARRVGGAALAEKIEKHQAEKSVTVTSNIPIRHALKIKRPGQ